MSHGDKDGSGEMTHGELKIVLRKYAKYKNDADDILDLIKKYDKNQDCNLDDDELRELMKAAVGVHKVEDEDVAAVRAAFHKYSKKQRKVDPDALAKAISEWDDENDLSESMFANGIGLDSFRCMPRTFVLAENDMHAFMHARMDGWANTTDQAHVLCFIHAHDSCLYSMYFMLSVPCFGCLLRG